MAIKGKTKRRGGGRARAAMPPKPVIVERKRPLLARKPVRRAIIGVLVLAALLGGLRVWQNLGRSHALKTYSTKLTNAQDLLSQHLGNDTLTSMSRTLTAFSSGELSAKQLLDVGKLWESDFGIVKTKVAKLKPPKQLGDGQQLMLEGIDEYIGVARLYQAAALQQQLTDATAAKAKAEKNPAFKKVLEDRAKAERDQMQVLMLHAGEWRQRADRVFQLGFGKLEDLKRAWGIAEPAPSLGDLQIPQQ